MKKLLFIFFLLTHSALAQISQQVVETEILTNIFPNGRNEISGQGLQNTLNLMTTSIFQNQGLNGFSVTGIPSVGQSIVATGPTTATWQNIAAGITGTVGNVVVIGPLGTKIQDSSNVSIAKIPTNLSVFGHVNIGVTSDQGRALFVQGPDTSGSTQSVVVRNSSSQNLLTVADNGQVNIPTNILLLGGVGTVLGRLDFANTTSGTIQLSPPATGALGASIATLPINTGTIAETNLTQTWSAPQTYSAQLNTVGIASTQAINFGIGSDTSAATSGFFKQDTAVGNCTGVGRQCVLNTFQMLDAVQDTGAQGLFDWFFNVGWGGGSTQGPRTAVKINGVLNQGAVSASGAHQYAAFGTLAATNQNLGGVMGSPVGAFFGANPACQLASGATFLNQCVGIEVNPEIDAGASANQLVGIQIVQPSGSTVRPFDAAYGLSFNNNLDVGSATGWDFLIVDGGGAGFPALRTDGVFISCRAQGDAGGSCGHGIGSFADLNNYTSVANWILRGPAGNGSIDGNFVVDATAYKTAGVAGVDCSGSPTSSFASSKGIVTHC